MCKHLFVIIDPQEGLLTLFELALSEARLSCNSLFRGDEVNRVVVSSELFVSHFPPSLVIRAVSSDSSWTVNEPGPAFRFVFFFLRSKSFRVRRFGERVCDKYSIKNHSELNVIRYQGKTWHQKWIILDIFSTILRSILSLFSSNALGQVLRFRRQIKNRQVREKKLCSPAGNDNEEINVPKLEVSVGWNFWLNL